MNRTYNVKQFIDNDDNRKEKVEANVKRGRPRTQCMKRIIDDVAKKRVNNLKITVVDRR